MALLSSPPTPPKTGLRIVIEYQPLNVYENSRHALANPVSEVPYKLWKAVITSLISDDVGAQSVDVIEPHF